MVAAFMDYLDLRDYKFISGERMMEYIHAAQQEIVQQIIDEDPSFFVATSTLSMVANQATYDLPLNARRGTRIIFGENLTSSSANGVNLPVPPARIRDYFMFSDYSLSNQHPFYHFAMENDQIRILSKPTAGDTNAIKIWYVPTYGNMLEGLVNSVASTTFGLSQAVPNYTTNYGVVDRRNDYYNGMMVEIVGGTGVGQVRQITDYDGSTRICTVDTAWTTNPDISGDDKSTYAVHCPVMEDDHETVALRAAVSGAIKNKSRQKDLRSEYYGYPGQAGKFFKLMAKVGQRQMFASHAVEPSDFGD